MSAAPSNDGLSSAAILYVRYFSMKKFSISSISFSLSFSVEIIVFSTLMKLLLSLSLVSMIALKISLAVFSANGVKLMKCLSMRVRNSIDTHWFISSSVSTKTDAGYSNISSAFSADALISGITFIISDLNESKKSSGKGILYCFLLISRITVRICFFNSGLQESNEAIFINPA